jgi:hypothetical protein
MTSLLNLSSKMCQPFSGRDIELVEGQQAEKTKSPKPTTHRLSRLNTNRWNKKLARGLFNSVDFKKILAKNWQHANNAPDLKPILKIHTRQSAARGQNNLKTIDNVAFNWYAGRSV